MLENLEIARGLENVLYLPKMSMSLQRLRNMLAFGAKQFLR